jgi:hypothetical protein
MIRKIITTLLITVVTSMVALADARISMAEKSHDFGIIKEDGGAVTHSFAFTNTGDSPLVIVSAKASCGCTQPKYPTDPVKPGETAKITVKYLPQGRPGEFNKTIKVRTNDKKNKSLSLRITGTVTPAAK